MIDLGQLWESIHVDVLVDHMDRGVNRAEFDDLLRDLGDEAGI